MPGEAYPPGGFPKNNLAPLKTTAISMFFINSSANMFFKYNSLDPVAANRRSSFGPPITEPSREFAKGGFRIPGNRDGTFNWTNFRRCHLVLGSNAKRACRAAPGRTRRPRLGATGIVVSARPLEGGSWRIRSSNSRAIAGCGPGPAAQAFTLRAFGAGFARCLLPWERMIPRVARTIPVDRDCAHMTQDARPARAMPELHAFQGRCSRGPA